MRVTHNDEGFTIIELMIATAVLSTMLVVVTTIMISIGSLYYKGVNQARVQDDVRSITDDVAQHIQLNLTKPVFYVPPGVGSNVQAYCIGDTRYVFVLGEQIGDGTDTDGATPQSHDVLWRDAEGASCPTPGSDFLNSPDTSGTELIAPGSRLTAFSITPTTTGTYTIIVDVAYGAIDLLNLNSSLHPAAPIDSISPDGTSIDTSITCKGDIGRQFCATASLTTTVAQRLTSE